MQSILLAKFKEHTCTIPPPAESVDDLIGKSSDTPLSSKEDKLATSFARRKLHGSQDGVIQFQTGGQVLLIIKIVENKCMISLITAYDLHEDDELPSAFFSGNPQDCQKTDKGAGAAQDSL